MRFRFPHDPAFIPDTLGTLIAMVALGAVAYGLLVLA